MYNPPIYAEPAAFREGVRATHSYTRKFCGCMSLKAGSLLACGIWLGLNLYGAVLSFQGRSPIFSYLNRIVLIIQGVVCVLFCIATLFTIFAVISTMPLFLQVVHRTIWFMVFLFTVNLFVDLVLFGVQRPQFESWCIQRSQERLSAELNMPISAEVGDASIYNCSKLWEDELKFSIVIFILITICFVYWATCLWSYSQKQISLLTAYEMSFYPGAAHPMHAPGVMRNIGKSGTAGGASSNKGQSLAEVSRHVASQINSLFVSRKPPTPNPTEKPPIPTQ